jgi:hypothetical protein
MRQSGVFRGTRPTGVPASIANARARSKVAAVVMVIRIVDNGILFVARSTGSELTDPHKTR